MMNHPVDPTAEMNATLDRVSLRAAVLVFANNEAAVITASLQS